MSPQNSQRGFLRYQLPAIAWAALIFISSSIPAHDIPHWALFRFDKAIHAINFFLLCLLSERALRCQDRFPSLQNSSMIISIFFSAVYGFLDETHQRFVAGRTADVFDFLADMAGACVFMAVHTAAGWYRRRSAPGSGS